MKSEESQSLVEDIGYPFIIWKKRRINRILMMKGKISLPFKLLKTSSWLNIAIKHVTKILPRNIITPLII